MILVTLIAVLFVGGLACWLSERFNPICPGSLLYSQFSSILR